MPSSPKGKIFLKLGHYPKSGQGGSVVQGQVKARPYPPINEQDLPQLMATNYRRAKRLIVWPAVGVFEQKESAFNCVRIKSMDTTKQLAIEACAQLVAAYKEGERNGGSVDWNDVNEAWRMAKAALKEQRRDIRAKKALRPKF